ncbi:hypothetical protein ACQKL5_14950 [Peribacillus sp. NPDC097675]|uniref:hypothetical protein n=1 Tax=Peribacillus sp. NPDC097675 TaxID=3390618 RepID=UPI003D01D4E0
MNFKKLTLLVVPILFIATTICSQEIYANSSGQNVPNDNKNQMASLNMGASNTDSNKIFTEKEKRELQNEITDSSDEYGIVNAGLTTDPTHTLYFSSNGYNNHYYTQIFEGHINLHNDHKKIEKQGKWSLVPDSRFSSEPQQKKYIIAASETTYKNKPFTIIIQTYDIQTDSYASPYTKTEILNFANSLQVEALIKSYE